MAAPPRRRSVLPHSSCPRWRTMRVQRASIPHAALKKPHLRSCSQSLKHFAFIFQLIQTRPPHAASNHATFAGGESYDMTCGVFVLHNCILLPCSSQSRWSAQRAHPHERAHAPPARADTHTRQTPASMQRAVRRRGPRLSFD